MLFEILEKVVRVTKAVKEPRVAVDHVEKNPAHFSPIFRGRHRVFYETCTGCDACRKICPVDAIVMKPLPLKRPNKIPEVNLAICIFCGLCEDVCPTKPKSIILAGGDFYMPAPGTHKDLENFWVRVEVPEEWIEQKKREEEEKARKRREMLAKKKGGATGAQKPAGAPKPAGAQKPAGASAPKPAEAQQPAQPQNSAKQSKAAPQPEPQKGGEPANSTPPAGAQESPKSETPEKSGNSAEGSGQ